MLAHAKLKSKYVKNEPSAVILLYFYQITHIIACIFHLKNIILIK